MNRKICSLSITFNLECDGLIGGTHEYNPYLAWHTSFGKHRLKTIDRLRRKKRITLASLGANKEEEKAPIVMDKTFPRFTETTSIDIELNDYDTMKGDDAIMFKLFAHTRDSGVDSLDVSDGKYVERQISAGLCQLELYDIFGYYLKNCDQKNIKNYNQERQQFRVTDRFVDQKMLNEKIRDLLHAHDGDVSDERFKEAMQVAKPLTVRASIAFDIVVHNFNYALYKKSIFNNKTLKQTGLHATLKLNHNNTSLSSSYAKEDVPAFEPMLYNSKVSWQRMATSMSNLLDVYCKNFLTTTEMGNPLYKPSEEAIANLQLPLYDSEHGKMPVYAYWSNHDPYFREYASEKTRLEELELYGFREKMENHLLMALRSSLRRHNLSEKRFIETIKNHFSPTNQSESLDPYFLLAEETIADVGTFMANSAYYTADYRFIPLVNEAKESLARMRRHKEIKMKIVGIDSWDNVILNDTAMCDDCEGQDNTASTITRSISIGRVDMDFSWQSEALRAAQQLLQYSVIFDVGALVTSAFVDTNNKKIDERQDELPLIGSELDKNAQNDGHCFAIMQSLTRTIAMLAKGNTTDDVIRKMRTANRISAAFDKRDAMRSTLVLEPTGSIEPRILSLEESYGRNACNDPQERLFAKKNAEMHFMKHLRLKLKELGKDSGVADLFVGEGLPHYIDTQVPQRRVSDFYNSVVHGSSIDLYKRFGVTLSQIAFTKTINNEILYGVRIGELIRASGETDLAIVCPYRDYKTRWMSEIVPLVESVQNQMPLMKFGRYSDEEYENDIYSRFATHSLTEEINESKNGQMDPAFARLLVESESLDSGKTIVRLYSRLWKLRKDKEATNRLATFLDSMPGMIKYGCFVEKHMPVCEPIVEILCIIDVQKCLSLPMKAETQK